MRWDSLRIWFVVGASAFLWMSLPANADDNIDPNDSGAQFAWGENVGWQNAEPQPPGAALPGVLVTGSRVTGFLWAENLGWISLSCDNRGTCGSGSYGVTNDGLGKLSGFAWSENVGWIKFAPEVAGTPVGGVTIDPGTGSFSGTAWGENIGWINFSFSPALKQYQVQTSWMAPTPTATPTGPTPTRTPTGGTPTSTGSANATRSITATPGPVGVPSTGSGSGALFILLFFALALETRHWGRRAPSRAHHPEAERCQD